MMSMTREAQTLTRADELQGTAKPTKVRVLIAVMLFLTVVINYMDRANLSVAIPALTQEFGLTPQMQGILLSAFGWTYAALQLPGGVLIDRVPPRVLYPACLLLWSLATVFMGMSGGFIMLIILRLCTGAFEAPAYPINNRVATAWFPNNERATAIGFYTSGQFIGLALLTPVLTWLQTTFTWHWVFIVTGIVGIVWAVLWFVIYREPRDMKSANAAEIAYIRDGGGLTDIERDRKKATFSLKACLPVLKSRKLWGLYIGQFALTTTLWFFLTWFPTYLVQYRGMSYIKSGFLVSLPYIAALVGVLLGGVISDFLLKRNFSAGFARKGPIIIGLLLSTSIIGAVFIDDTAVVIALMSIAFFGNGFASITWSLVSAIAPEHLLGTTGGMFNFIGNLSSIATPIVVGFLVTSTNFAPAFVYVAAVTVIGILSYVFLVGKVERIDAPAV